nr:tyrosine--tRNA ligase [Lachnospiraceae bacterium]
QEAARKIFSGELDVENMPETKLTDSDFLEGKADILQLLVAAKLSPSRSDARRLVNQGGVAANDEKITDFRKSYTKEELKDGVVLKKGKKVYHRITV